jgi:hypothetical protein
MNSKRLVLAIVAASLLAGCQSNENPSSSASTAKPMPAPTPVIAPAAPPAAAAPAVTPTPAAVAPPAIGLAPVPPPVRIKAGPSDSFTDAEGNVWLPEQGFADGDTVDRGNDVQIANTKTPAIYRSERYSMTSFSYPVPNGKYTVKLHFAETFDGITGPGERVFSFNVEGHEFKDFDVFVKAGGALRAYVETVNVEITDGKLDITFTPNVENPQINGIEILPNP